MSTYAIGDIQGCYAELQKLLELIAFNPKEDRLWFVGDLVNRGPNSLEALRFIKDNKAIVVLGNHDWHLLAAFHRKDPLQLSHTLDAVFQAPDSHELIDWLRQQPLLYSDEKLGYVMVHAGIYPNWDLIEAKKYAKEVEEVLRSDDYVDILDEIYGNKPTVWDPNLKGVERLRFIVNSFTRMRFCNSVGELDFTETGNVDTAPSGFMPWFKVPLRKLKNYPIVFGHWASLAGEVDEPNVYALDTGCVWGGGLSALRLEDKRKWIVK